MGYPILGDPQYGSGDSQTLSAEMGLVSQLLCAKRLHFPHPITGEEMQIESKLDTETEKERTKGSLVQRELAAQRAD